MRALEIATSHTLALIAALLLGLGSRLAAEDVEWLREALPDGGRVERQVLRHDSGRAIDHGEWRSFHANGEPAAAGQCAYGLREGVWTFHHDNGQLAEEGKYIAGRRVGKWVGFHPDGSAAYEGLYRRGFRTGKWNVYDERGIKTGDSGEYKARFLHYDTGELRAEGSLRVGKEHGPWRWYRADGTLACEGVFKNGRRNGAWAWYDPDGSLRLTGSYVRGARDGAWLFRHADGTPDPAFLSATWRKGKRKGPVEGVAPDLDSLNPASWPSPPAHPDLSDDDVEEVRRQVARFVEGNEAQQADALEQLEAWEVAAIPAALEALRRLDARLDATAPGGEGDTLTAYRVNYVLLHQATGGHLLPWDSGGGPAARAANRLALRRWFTLWELTAARPEFWERVRATPPDEAEDLLMWLLLEGDPEPLAWEAGPVDPRAEEEAVARAAIDARLERRGTRAAVEAGLAWLQAHQAEHGGWDASLAQRCPPDDVCTGDAEPGGEEGLTGLALLAFLDAGSTLRSGPHRESVRRAVEFLQARQDTRTGIIGRSASHKRMYGHAIATQALARAARDGDHPLLEVQVQVAVDAIARARNPDGVWRYDVEPRGENDTSVTGWMVKALLAADASGFRIDVDALAAAVEWVEAMTHPETGRTGYDAPNSFSARTPENQGYPADLGEPMTAVGLYVRLACDASLEPARVERSVALLLRTLPARVTGEPGNDLYYWSQGADALARLGGDAWETWEPALRTALLAGQRPAQPGGGHAAGSWDPDGPWGFAGGRVYATALAVRALLVDVR